MALKAADGVVSVNTGAQRVGDSSSASSTNGLGECTRVVAVRVDLVRLGEKFAIGDTSSADDAIDNDDDDDDDDGDEEATDQLSSSGAMSSTSSSSMKLLSY